MSYSFSVFIVLLSVACGGGILSAGVGSDEGQESTFRNGSDGDIARAVELIGESEQQGEGVSEEKTVTKVPLTSVLRSVVLPGWGQFYTEHPYKGSFIFTIEGFLLTLAWSENRKAAHNWDIYQRSGDSAYLDKYDQKLKRADNLLSFALALFLYNIADAYVSAHLYDFAGKVTFEEERGQLDLSMSWRFH